MQQLRLNSTQSWRMQPQFTAYIICQSITAAAVHTRRSQQQQQQQQRCQMPGPCVYGLLLQAFHADKSAARLTHALEELAGRLEAAESSSSSAEAGLRLQDNRTCSDLGNLQLPDPAQGPLPVWSNACEHAALQAAVEEVSSSLSSTAERRAWRTWAMSPQHMVHVVEAAWLLVALVFRQGSACAIALQAHVCEQIQRHHVSAVLAGQEPVKGCSSLWAQALADAACRLLRVAYPAVLELHDQQLQVVLQRQLRLYTTGLLPSDAAAPALRAAQQKAAVTAAAASSGADDTSAAADAAGTPSASQRSSSCAGGDDDQQQAAAHACRHTAQFSSAKPGAAVSGFMAQQGLQPAPEFLQAHAGELTRITLPAQLIHQQQQATSVAEAADVMNRLQLLRLSSQASTCSVTAASPAPGASACAGCSTETKGPGSRAKAAACMAAASQAVKVYEKRKAAAAAAVKAGSLSAQVAVQALARQKARAVALGPSQAKEASNRVSGYLSESGAATTCLVAKAPAGSPSDAIRGSATAAAGSPARSTPGAQGNSNSSSRPSKGPRGPKPLPTDLDCKAQRHVLENTLRAGDWRMAHACTAMVAVHDKCTNLAAQIATMPPAPVTPAPPPAAVAMAGQDWGALVSSSVARHHLRGVAAGGGRSVAGMVPSSGCDVKVMKAARAIVEDVQKAFAASGSPPLGRNRR